MAMLLPGANGGRGSVQERYGGWCLSASTDLRPEGLSKCILRAYAYHKQKVGVNAREATLLTRSCSQALGQHLCLFCTERPAMNRTKPAEGQQYHLSNTQSVLGADPSIIRQRNVARFILSSSCRVQPHRLVL